MVDGAIIDAIITDAIADAIADATDEAYWLLSSRLLVPPMLAWLFRFPRMCISYHSSAEAARAFQRCGLPQLRGTHLRRGGCPVHRRRRRRSRDARGR